MSTAIRIGPMGEQSRAHLLFRTLHALGTSMRAAGAALDLPAGMAELERALQVMRTAEPPNLQAA